MSISGIGNAASNYFWYMLTADTFNQCNPYLLIMCSTPLRNKVMFWHGGQNMLTNIVAVRPTVPTNTVSKKTTNTTPAVGGLAPVT